MTTDRKRQSNELPSGERTGPEHYVLSGGPVGQAVARQLQSEGHTVGFVDETADPDAGDVRGDPSELATLDRSGISGASTAVVAGDSDRRNLLIAQLLTTHFDVSRVLVRVNDPDRADLFGAAGHEPVCAATILATTIAEDV